MLNSKKLHYIFILIAMTYTTAPNTFALSNPYKNTNITLLADLFEDDNDFLSANPITINKQNTPQHHNFHDASDEDWLMFYGIKNKDYQIDVNMINPFSKCKAVVSLYDSDGITCLKMVKKGLMGLFGNKQLTWSCDSDGIYYIRISNYDPTIFGETSVYSVTVVYPTAYEYPGILEGTIKDNDKNPIKNAYIKTKNNEYSAMSEEDGKFIIIFKGDFATYTLTIKASGFQKFEEPIDISDNEPVEKTFFLEKSSSLHQINISVTGNGYITSQPDGITCDTVCKKRFKTGTFVALTAQPDFQWIFSGWNDYCSGTNICCKFFLQEDITVSTIFNKRTNLLNNIILALRIVSGFYEDIPEYRYISQEKQLGLKEIVFMINEMMEDD